ncbi:hypothetical protein ALI144C_19190 [Actinosynnema sp. ALI-1.44]|uniref:WXG100 family type VII secretion target n=1 Tax=Actinosynnema sp. ALI-1.44 TaxID=1933779 RepID=UPI00097BB299|nr:hypothetical protein [Actinosynnema sp. ALI-1.44]ONI81459.1 hypothetical protein ALI144C_19190 [Actinosynnema sp. ALI-1.44]
MSTDRTTTRLLAELSTVSNAVLDSDWSTGPLAALPTPAGFGPLTSSATPLDALSSAGVGMLTPHVAFLAKPLDQFRGDSGVVSALAQGMAAVAVDVRALADTYRQAGTTETSGWTGEAADRYQAAGTQFTEGVTVIAEAAKTVSGAVIGAGEEVVKAITRIVQLIDAAVAEMIPVMADGIARAPLTMGTSVTEAITKCVAIANGYSAQIADVMANLLANATNLMKLVDSVLTIVHTVTQLLRKLAKGDSDSSAADATPQANPESGEQTAAEPSQSTSADDPTASTGTAPSTGADRATSGLADPTASTAGDTDQAASRPTNTTGATSSASPLSTSSTTAGTPSGDRGTNLSPGSGIPLSGVAAKTGAVSKASAAPKTSAAPNRGTPETRLAPGGATFAVPPKEMTAGGPAATAAAEVAQAGGPFMPMTMPAAARGQGADDSEHQRRYEVNADGDTFSAGDQDALAASGVIDPPVAAEDDERPSRATPAEPQPAAAPPEDEAPRGKVVWRLGENGELVATVVPAPPDEQ